MKDEEFQKNLETILERFEKIDAEIKKFLKREDLKSEEHYLDKEPLSYHTKILDTKYKTKKIGQQNKYQRSKKKTFI